ncbi:acetoin utilization protein acuB [Aureibaculum sp. A20]|uniref:Acetoin utilization protein acuB n=1 Tax=Aureibaculum flavum TaxID=2795986 RepID=A0ABS0WVR9_9FLAO|nr:acetoin utilization protein acuB [Aureibaculum flavum]MBJ2176101.1 acetoin utilization protein acuB [Aureibaculum flavum]
MITSDYISKDVRALQTTDKVSKAKGLFNLLTFTHLPVIEQGNFMGLIAENDVQTITDDDQLISEYSYLFQSFFARKNTNWFELLKIFALNEATIIPVVTEKLKYLGYYELADILHIFNSTPFLNQSGAVMVVSKGVSEYSFSEISQIVESNNAKLLGAFISNINKETAEITIKISDHDLNNTIQSFRRYNYTILNSFHVDEYLNTLKERSDYLQKYLDI